jgi:hypothetical protein
MENQLRSLKKSAAFAKGFVGKGTAKKLDSGFFPVRDSLLRMALRRTKNLHLCRVDAFENPLFSMGASCPGFGSHYRVGLQAPDKLNLGSLRVLLTGSSKVPPIHEHRRG